MQVQVRCKTGVIVDNEEAVLSTNLAFVLLLTIVKGEF